MAIQHDIDNLDLFESNRISLVEAQTVVPEPLTLEQKIERTTQVIHGLLADSQNLVVAFSGGKDSSVLANIFLQALRSYVALHGSAPQCLIVHSNTLIENPLVELYAKGELNKIRAFCTKHDLPVQVDVVSPNTSNNYLVNIIGGRMIAVDALTDSSCSVMMKVNPINKHKSRVLKQFGKHNVTSLVGTRFDESALRARKMSERQDSWIDVVVNEAGERVLCPIADFTLDDVFFYIGYVRSEKIDCYSDFTDLVDIYSEANGGDCMVNVYASGKASSTPCGARTGCHQCLRAEDRSMVNMLEDPKNQFMQPLFALRNYIKDNQYDPSKRNWLGRSVSDEGTVRIAANAYSPAYCEELLRIVLTIQMRENRAADDRGIAPRFMLLRYEDLIAIEVLWSRYGYHPAASVMQIFDEVVHQGIETDIPEVKVVHSSQDFPKFTANIPFKDAEYDAHIHGLRDVEAIQADCERTVPKKDGRLYSDVNTDVEFGVDPEAAELFFEFELDAFLKMYAKRNSSPSTVYHYFMRLGVVSLSKGGHSENDRMLRMGNLIFRKNLGGILNDPHALVEALTGKPLTSLNQRFEEDQMCLFEQLA
ncbi:MAG: hypothetical protein C9356_12155 [Oleiphilus sp.]|nr:MAG: hypothetical protein C9356_12155 [Oleiphilus sp.]